MKLLPLAIILTITVTVSESKATADGPDFWRITGVQAGGAVNIRKGPATGFSIVGKVTSGTTGLKNLGCSPELLVHEWQGFTLRERELALSLRWCRIQHGQITGWVYSRYLIED